MIFETVVHDLQYGLRMFRRNVRSTVVMVSALSLGIGVCTAVLTAYKSILARPVDARDSDRIVNLALTRRTGAVDYKFSYPDYEAYRSTVASFSGVVTFRPARVTVSATGLAGESNARSGQGLRGVGLIPTWARKTESASVFVVSENYFKVLGVGALKGRTFESTSRDDLLRSPSVLISENYWTERYSGDPGILGKVLRLNGVSVAVIGITPRDFVGTGLSVPAFWVPVTIDPMIEGDAQWLQNRENRPYRLFARLGNAVAYGRAETEMASVAAHLQTLHDPRSETTGPANALIWPGSPFPLPITQYRGLNLAVMLIVAAAAMVLCVACANVGSLQLARARSRENELRTRLSLGASRLRVVRQLVTESCLLGLFAGTAALLCSWAFLRLAIRLAVQSLPIEEGALVFDVTPDLSIFFGAGAVSIFAGMISGLAPAFQSSRSALISGTRGSTLPVHSRRTQDTLVAVQVAFSLVLLIAGSLLVRSAVDSLRMPVGYDNERVVCVEFEYPRDSRYTDDRRRAFIKELRGRLIESPSVAAVTSARPPGSSRFRTIALAEGQTQQSAGQALLRYSFVQSNYFELLGLPLVLGNPFPSAATQRDASSVIISESAAKELWPGENPVGRHLRLGPVDELPHHPKELSPQGPTYQVVGVARDKRALDFDANEAVKEIYLPLAEDRIQNYPLLTATRGQATQHTKTIEAILSSVAPDVAFNLYTLKEMLRRSGVFIVSSVGAAVAFAVGLFGLLLTSMGIYGTVSYIVVLRTREVGIRMAIGAERGDILRLVLRDSMKPVAFGLGAGMVLAGATAYGLRGLLSGFSVLDGLSFLAAALGLLGIALFASCPPAWRATRIDPNVALRFE